MTKAWLIAALLRVYPVAWRREYGGELADLLLGRPFTARAMADVAWNGLWQRGRTAEPSTILGLTSIFVMLGGFAASRAVLRPTSMTFPAVRVSLLKAEFSVLLLVACGFWTYLRHGGKVTRSGVAAMRMSLIAGIPILVIVLLMMLGSLDLMFYDAPGAAASRPIAWTILIARLAQVLEAWIWGSIGGLLGKYIARRRQRAA